jgi:hypothetical protein
MGLRTLTDTSLVRYKVIADSGEVLRLEDKIETERMS